MTVIALASLVLLHDAAERAFVYCRRKYSELLLKCKGVESDLSRDSISPIGRHMQAAPVVATGDHNSIECNSIVSFSFGPKAGHFLPFLYLPHLLFAL